MTSLNKFTKQELITWIEQSRNVPTERSMLLIRLETKHEEYKESYKESLNLRSKFDLERASEIERELNESNDAERKECLVIELKFIRELFSQYCKKSEALDSMYADIENLQKKISLLSS